MNIGGIFNNHHTTLTPIGKVGTGNNQRISEKDNDENNRNDLSSIAIAQNNGKKKEISLASMLMERKESMKKHIEGLQKRLTNIGDLKETLPYEEVKTMVNGKEVIKKVYSDEDSKMLKRLESQENTLSEKIKSLTEEMDGLDGEIAAAIAMEQSRKLEKEKQEQEEAREKAAEQKVETKEEQERKEQLKQNEFLIQSDSIKKYVQSGKAIKAKLEQELTRKENEIATDALNTATMEQSALHHEFPIEEEPVPNTSFINEQARIRDGKLSKSERHESGGKLDDLKIAIARTQESINSQLRKINNEVDELRNDKSKVAKEDGDDKEMPLVTALYPEMNSSPNVLKDQD